MELVFALLLWWAITGVACAICYGIFIFIDYILGKNILRKGHDTLRGNKMKKLAVIVGVILCLGNINAKIISNDDIKKVFDECIEIQEGQKQICQKYIDSGLPSINNCNKETCLLIGIIYKNAGHFNQAEQYYNQAMALDNNYSYGALGDLYETQNNLSKAKKIL